MDTATRTQIRPGFYGFPTKCLGCRCRAPMTNRPCRCCRVWPAVLECVVCGEPGRFDTDLLVMVAGPTHDRCRAEAA